MPLLCTRRRWWLRLGLAATLAASLSACGADRVETVAREKALELLQDNVTATITCLSSLVSRLDPAQGSGGLADELSECVDTTVLNRDDDYILSDEVELPVGNETIGVSAVVSGDRIVLELATQGVGTGLAGVASARVTLTTCWQVKANLVEDVLEDPSEAACNDSVLERIIPTDLVPFSDLHVPGV